MSRRTILSLYVVLALMGGLGLAQSPPVFVQTVQDDTIREMDYYSPSVTASDPDNDPLTYLWTIESDGTLGAAFINGGANTRAVVIGLNGGASFPVSSYSGQVIQIKVVVSDGTHQIEDTANITVNGVNLPPVVNVDMSGAGTLANPRITGEPVLVNSSQSYDPDGSWEPLWKYSTGAFCPGVNAPTLFGNYSDFPTITNLPEVASVGVIVFELFAEDGLHQIYETFTGYIGPDSTPCAQNGSPPIVSINAVPLHAKWGQGVAMTANVLNPEQFDTYTYSWKQLGTTAGSTPVPLQTPDRQMAQFVAPQITGILNFEVTVTDAQGSGKKQVAIQVSENGGTTGPPPDGQTNEGTSTGTVSGCSVGNVPAQGVLPATIRIAGGQQVEIQAQSVTDPDDTTVFVSGFFIKGAVVTWKVIEGRGQLSDSDFSPPSGETVHFNAPAVGIETTFVVRAEVMDPKLCGNDYNIDLVVSPSAAQNSSPASVLKYSLPPAGFVVAPGGAVDVAAPLTILLSAQASTDPDSDSLSYSWSVDDNLQGGSASLVATVSNALKELQLSGGTGTVSVTVTVSDGKGGQSSSTATFNAVEDSLPVSAEADLVSGDQSVAGQVVEAGSELTLDPSGTNVEDGTGSEVLTYTWEQTQGQPQVFVSGSSLGTKIQASTPADATVQIKLPDVEDSVEFEFRLTVKNGIETDSKTVSVTAEPSSGGGEASKDLYFAQVGFGVIGNLKVSTVLVIDNVSSESVEDLAVAFYRKDGTEDEVHYIGDDGKATLWTGEEVIGPNSSRVFELVEPEGSDEIMVGWAHVSASLKLRGSVRYQLTEVSTGDPIGDVGIFSSPKGREFQLAFRKKDSLAWALANPGEDRLTVWVDLYDDSGEFVSSLDPIGLQPGQHKDGYADFEGIDLESGTLRVEVDSAAGEIIPLFLVTRDRLPLSSQSFSRVK